MSGPWIRTPVDRGDDARALLAAGAVAACVGLVTFYLARLVFAREKLPGGAASEGAEDPAGGGVRA